MGLLSTKTTTLLLVIFFNSATLFINPTRAWDDDGDDDWLDDSGSEEVDTGKADAKSIVAPPQENHDHSNHDQHLHSAGAFGGGNVPDSPKQLNIDGSQGANQAAFNESCGPTGKKCINLDNLQCSATDGTGRCVCKEGYVYVRSTETCWVIPKSGQDACSHDVQCHEGRWGRISRCNKVTARCECHDFFASPPRKTIRVDGICYIKKDVGALCTTNEECDAPIAGDAYCNPGDHSSAGGQNLNGSCQCKDSSIWHKPLTECLLLATKLGEQCKVSEQCRESTLGKNSRCDRVTATCLCGPPRGSDEEIPPSVFYPALNKCFLKKEYNSTCEEINECKASLGPDVECGTTEDSVEDKICHCPTGKVCRSSAFSISPSWVYSVVVIGVALVMYRR